MSNNEDPRMTPRADLIGELYDEEEYDVDCGDLSADYYWVRESHGLIELLVGESPARDILLTPEEAENLANQLLSLAQDIRDEENK